MSIAGVVAIVLAIFGIVLFVLQVIAIVCLFWPRRRGGRWYTP